MTTDDSGSDKYQSDLTADAELTGEAQIPDIAPLPDQANNESTNEMVDDAGGGFDVRILYEPDVYIPVGFVDVVLHLPSSYPTLILEELDQPHRRIMIPIGMPEGVAIAHAARGIATPKPLTHALLGSVMSTYGVSVEVMRIYGVKNNSFNAELVFSGPSGQHTLICRVSDGVALCLRQRPPVPITVSPGVIDQVGITSSWSS